jgi:mono/diheme cytochrome c family protein
MKRKLLLTITATAFICIGLAFTAVQQTKPWPVPSKDAKAVNPIKSNAESIAAGKALYTQHCASCHGKKGLGDGSKSAQLKTQPQDMSKSDLQEQTDGALYYKIVAGRDDMPSFKKKIPDTEDLWSVINYVRTFKK